MGRTDRLSSSQRARGHRSAAALTGLFLLTPFASGCIAINAFYVEPSLSSLATDTGGDTDETTGDATLDESTTGDATTGGGTSGGGTTDDGGTTGDATTSDGTTGAGESEPVCGDGVVEGDEACDGGPDNGLGPCTEACEENVCGDDYIGPGESCDDGNLEDGDGCSGACVLESCGNGLVEPGESCDDGNLDETDECTNSCTLPDCGDGIIQPAIGEECDDGDGDNNDECTSECLAAACGDGYVQGEEQCDDGDEDPFDSCSNLCNAAPLGVMQSEFEGSGTQGQGDPVFEPACANNQIMTGLSLHGDPNDNVIKAAQVHCADLAFVGGVDQWVTLISNEGPIDQLVGPAQDVILPLHCPAGSAIASFSGATQFGYFRRLDISCAPLALTEGGDGFSIEHGAPSPVGAQGYAGGDVFGQKVCPVGKVATGASLGVSAGLFTSMQLRCHDLELEF